MNRIGEVLENGKYAASTTPENRMPICAIERGPPAASYELPHPEERPLGRVSKDEDTAASWFETRQRVRANGLREARAR
jgi:hypothetical protein